MQRSLERLGDGTLGDERLWVLCVCEAIAAYAGVVCPIALSGVVRPPGHVALLHSLRGPLAKSEFLTVSPMISPMI